MEPNQNPKISVLIAARKNSKYLAKFLHGYFARTADQSQVQVLVMLNKNDTWNRELVENYSGFVQFFYEDEGLGRAGLHEYFNELYKYATGEWYIYFCEDHFIIQQDWDQYMLGKIEEWNLNFREPWCLVPKFDNVGAMNHVLSLGWIDALGGKLGKHGWIDSYINGVNHKNKVLRDRVKRFNVESFHDFTHDRPSPMDDAHTQSAITEAGKLLPKFETQEVDELITKDALTLTEAIE